MAKKDQFKKTKFSPSKNSLDRIQGLIKTLNNPLRQVLLNFIRDRKKVFVSEILNEEMFVMYQQSEISQQLLILRKYNLVIWERKGQFIFYMVNETKLEQINEIIEDLLRLK